MNRHFFLAACCLFGFSLPVLEAATPVDKQVSETSAKGRLPITISKATTYITEPLRADGYPDYLAALNQLTSKGVTSENNAAVVLVQAFGPEWIDSKDREKFFKMLGIAPPPDKGEYFVDYDTYVQKHAPDALKERDSASHWQMPLGTEQHLRALDRPWTDKECPLVAGWLAENEKPLARVAEASKRPYLYIPQIARREPEMCVSGEFIKQSSTFREVVRALYARAMRHIQKGDSQQAWNDLLTCHRLGRLEMQEPSEMDHLVAVTNVGYACQGDWQLAHIIRLTPKQVRQFCADIEKLPTLKSGLGKIHLSGRFEYLDAICSMARGSVKPSELFPTLDMGLFVIGNDPESKMLRKSLTTWVGSGLVDWDQALRRGNEYFDQLLVVAQKPMLSEQRDAASKLDEELKSQKASIFAGLPDKAEDRTPRSSVTKRVSVAILAATFGAAHIYPEIDARLAIDLQLVPVALALSAYRTEHGLYPDELGALRPKYLARLPEDPYGKGDYRYRRQDDGYLLYSVGPNGKDDKGPPPTVWIAGDDESLRDSDDIGIRMPFHNRTEKNDK